MGNGGNLNARQRFGWIVIVIILLSCPAIMTWRHLDRSRSGNPVEVDIRPIQADSTADLASTPIDSSSNHKTAVPQKKKKEKRTHRTNKRTKPAEHATHQEPVRDIVSEDLQEYGQ